MWVSQEAEAGGVCELIFVKIGSPDNMLDIEVKKFGA